jgi:sarcosine oxidase subunit gamma
MLTGRACEADASDSGTAADDMSDSGRLVDDGHSARRAVATLADIDLRVAWQARGDPLQPRFAAEAERLFGLRLPQPNATARTSPYDPAAGRLGHALLSLGPSTWLFTTDDPQQPERFDATRRTLNDAGGALFDVSASQVAWSVSGEGAARVLNGGCPLDLHPRVFPAGHCAQSLLAHIGALFYRPNESTFVVMVARSFAADARRYLDVFSAQANGIDGKP